MTARRLSAYFYLLSASIIWGIAAPVIKFTLTDFPPLIFLFYRFAIAAAVSVLYLLAVKPKLPASTKEAVIIFLVGFLTSTVTLGILFIGIEKTTSLSTNVISAMAPLLTAIAGVVFLKEHMSKLEKIGITIALIGTLISIVEPVLAADSNVFTATLTGNLLVFGSLMSGLIGNLLGKVVLKKSIDPTVLSHLMFIIGFITIAPFTLLQYDISAIQSTIMKASPMAHVGVLYMAFISGTLGYALHFKGLKSIEVGEASIFGYLMPIWGMPLSFFWLGEKVTGPFIVGSVFIAIGVVVAEYRRRSKKRRSRR